MEASCAFASSSKNDAIVAMPVLTHVAFQSRAYLDPWNELLCTKDIKTGRIYIKSQRRCPLGEHMSGLINFPRSRHAQTLLLRKKLHPTLSACEVDSGNMQHHHMRPCCSFSMGFVACPGPDNKTSGFWLYPGIAESVVQLQAFVHKGPRERLPCPYFLQSIACKSFTARHALTTHPYPTKAMRACHPMYINLQYHLYRIYNTVNVHWSTHLCSDAMQVEVEPCAIGR